MRSRIKSRADASRWEPDCGPYFDNYRDGRFDDFNQIQFILSIEDLNSDVERGELIIGYAGVDGIYFCFREGKSGVWAYYGIDDEYVLVAPNISDFVSRWEKREIVL